MRQRNRKPRSTCGNTLGFYFGGARVACSMAMPSGLGGYLLLQHEQEVLIR